MDAKKTISQCIDQGKWAVFCIGGDKRNPSFAYTVGLTHYGLNELLITGNLHPHNACQILNILGDMLRTRKENDRNLRGFTSGELVSLGAKFPLAIFDTSPVARNELMLKAHEYYHGSFRAQQVVYPDQQGRFPTHAQSAFITGQFAKVGQPLYLEVGAVLLPECTSNEQLV